MPGGKRAYFTHRLSIGSRADPRRARSR